MAIGTENTSSESLTSKAIFVTAFLLAAAGTYYLSSPFRHWFVANYPALDYLPIHAIVGLVLAAPVFFAEDRILNRLTGRDVFSSIRPVTIGVVVGYAVPYVFP
jgi:hypothetical protein